MIVSDVSSCFNTTKEHFFYWWLMTQLDLVFHADNEWMSVWVSAREWSGGGAVLMSYVRSLTSHGQIPTFVRLVKMTHVMKGIFWQNSWFWKNGINKFSPHYISPTPMCSNKSIRGNSVRLGLHTQLDYYVGQCVLSYHLMYIIIQLRIGTQLPRSKIIKSLVSGVIR